MRDVGGQVAVAIPLEDGSVAHRADWRLAQSRNSRGSTMQEQVMQARCGAGDVVTKWAPFSAGWADHMGAHACPTCFPEANDG